MSNRFMVTASCCMLMVLSGCGTAGHASSAPKPPETQNVKPSDKLAALEKRRQEGELLSLNERQMVLFFKDLLQIDKKEGLGFTRDQAEQMLPLIRNNSIRGELTQSDQSKIIEMLTPEQKRYYDEIRTRPPFPGVNPPPHEHFTTEELERRIEEFERRRGTEREQDMELANDKSRPDYTAGSVVPNRGKSVEQTLIELLKSKISP